MGNCCAPLCGSCCYSNQSPNIDLFSGNKRIYNRTEVVQMIHAALGEGCDVRMEDNSYCAPDLAVLERYLKQNKTQLLKYRAEAADCDDFSRVFVGDVDRCVMERADTTVQAGICVGYVAGMIARNPSDTPMAHAMNVAIVVQSGEARVILIEPQQNKIYDPNAQSTYNWVIV